MRIPSLLLTKLYVRGSLANEGKGFQFVIKNVLTPGTVVKLVGLSVDGKGYPPEEICLLINGVEKIEAVAISSQEPLPLDLGKEITVKVRGEELSAGPHQMLLNFLTQEAGELKVPLQDTIRG